MVNWVPIVAAALAALPAAGIFLVAFGRYEGAFRDNVVFIYFIGGLIVGGFLGFFTLLLYGTNATLIQIIGLALLYPITIVMAVNRRKWQGERHAIFNGGAAGLGASVMMTFSLLYVTMLRPMQAAQQAANEALRNATGNTSVSAPNLNTVGFAFDLVTDAQGLVLSMAMAGLFFGLGLLAGDAVRRKKQIVVALTGTAILIAPSVFLEEYFRSRAWLWLVLLVAYGAIFAIAAERKLLVLGLTDEDRKMRRRKQRSEE
ncbi:MAG: hypothetical protein WDA16_02450 [Candidatus Thermoplasmatota archaeon]